jgi:hypothetical protein
MTPRVRARAKDAFVRELAETGNVTTASRAANISRNTAYEWREADAAFKSLWDEAVDVSTDMLEAEARRRAVQGWDEPVFHQGRKVGKIRKYSDRMLEILLKGHRPEKFRERVDMKHSGRLTLEQLVEASKRDDAGS